MKACFTRTYLVCMHSSSPSPSPQYLHNYHHHMTGNKTWYVQNKVGLRKKANGPGCHVSAFTSYGLGFGVKVPNTSEVLRRANEAREGEAYAVDDSVKNQLVVNPAIRLCACLYACLRVCVRVCMCVCVCMCVLTLCSPPPLTGR